MAWLRWTILSVAPGVHGQHFHLGVSSEDALRWFHGSDASLPLSPAAASGLDETTFTNFARKGLPVVIKNGFEGTNFDVIEEPAKWSCDAIAKRFPSGRMKMEYTATGGHQDNPISLKDVESWSKATESSGAPDKEAPQFAPFYWGVKGADDGETLWDGKKDLLKQMRKLMKPLPKFLRQTQANQREILGSPEFWFARSGAGAKAHMDGHCESTLTLQLAGRKKWRLSWPPSINNGSFAKDGLLADGEPYNAKGTLVMAATTFALCLHLQGGWTPTHIVTLEPGEALLIPPAFVHESKNVGPEECAPSLTFQFADPVAAGFFRHFYPRLRRLGDFNECWERVSALATFDRSQKGLTARLKQLASTSISKLSQLDSSEGANSELGRAILQATKQAWSTVLSSMDRNKDGRLRWDDVSNDFQLQGSLDFHDLNEDNEVTEAEFNSGFGSWLMTEVVVMQERKQKPKTLKHLEF